MKTKTKLISVIILIVLAFGIYMYFKSDNNPAETTVVDLDNSTGLIENIDSNYVFEVSTKSLNLLDDEKETELIFEKTNNSYKLMPPTGGYLPYHFYTITLSEENQFLEKEFNNFKKISFYVRSDDKTAVAYQDGVTVDKNGKYANGILSTEKEYELGQIVIVGEGKECKALNILEKVNNKRYRCDTPNNIEDVYKSITINEYIDNDFQYIQADKNVILSYVKENEIFGKIFPNVNALSSKDITVKIPKKKNGKDPINIEIGIKANNIAVNFIIGFSYTVDCKTKNISYISEKRNLSFSLQLNITSQNSHSLRDKITSDLNEHELAEMYIESLKNQPAELNRVLDLFGIIVPIYGPINIYTDLGWKNETSFQPGLEDNSVFKLDIEIGYGVKNGKLIYKYVKPKYESDLSFSFAGKVQAKYGPTLEAGIDFMNGIRAGLQGHLGAYVDSYGTFRIEQKEVFLGDFQIGGFSDIAFVVSSPITKSELINVELGEQKLIIKSFSNIYDIKSNNLKNKYTYRNNGINLGNLEVIFYNKLTTHEEKFKIKNYTVYIDDEKCSSKDNKVNLSKDYIDSNHNIKIKFKHNGKWEEIKKDIEIVKENETYKIYNLLLSKGKYQKETINKNCRFLIYNLNNEGNEELVVVNNLDFNSNIKIYTNDYGHLQKIYDNTLSSVSLSVLKNTGFIIYNHIASDMNEVRIYSFNNGHSLNEKIYNFISRPISQTDWPWFDENDNLLPKYEKCIDGNQITFYSSKDEIIYSKSEFENKYKYSNRKQLDLLNNNNSNRKSVFNLSD